MTRSASIFLSVITLALAHAADASETSQKADPVMRCETAYSDTNGAIVKINFYIRFPDLNVVGADERVFFGGSKFYFSDGGVKNSSFLFDNPSFESYNRDEFERRNLIFISEGPYYLSTSNMEANKPKATFDIHIRRTGLASTKRENWNGTCQQISIKDDALFIELQSMEVPEE